MAAAPPPTSPPSAATPTRGVCSIFFAYDVGLAVDLAAAQARVPSPEHPDTTRHRRRAPVNFGYHTPPLRVQQHGPAVSVGSYQTAPDVECSIFDFGAVSIAYSISFDGPLDRLLELSDLLYENAPLLADSRERLNLLLRSLQPAVKKPAVSAFVEDYVLFEIESLSHDLRAPGQDRSVLDSALAHGPVLARVLRGEKGGLSAQEIEDALACRIAFAPDDAALIDWGASILVGPDMDDVRAVLEYANVELLEMRYLDDRLDRALDQSYLSQDARGRRRLLSGRSATELRAIAELQADSALLFEGVNNALKLLGDQYLARVYRLISQRLHLPEWDASILRKLGTLESIYQKKHDFQTTRRLEVLEWIVILLIGFELALSVLTHIWK